MSVVVNNKVGWFYGVLNVFTKNSKLSMMITTKKSALLKKLSIQSVMKISPLYCRRKRPTS